MIAFTIYAPAAFLVAALAAGIADFFAGRW